MDSESAHTLHGRLLSWFEQERERQMENRREMALDCDFYDGLQWNWEDAQVLIERGQAPLVYNLTKPTVDWIIGSERRLRVDWRVLPRIRRRGGERRHQDQGAEVPLATSTRRRSSAPGRSRTREGRRGLGGGRRSHGPDAWSRSTRATKAGATFGSTASATSSTMSDHRYLFRVKTLDTDVACAFFPDRANVIERASYGQRIDRAEEDEDFWYLGEQYSRAKDRLFTSVGSTRRVWYTDMNVAGARRDRVRLFECWYRDPMKVKSSRAARTTARSTTACTPA
jgi:hypothetical protein